MAFPLGIWFRSLFVQDSIDSDVFPMSMILYWWFLGMVFRLLFAFSVESGSVW